MIMQDIDNKTAHLLLDNYESIDNIKDMILGSPFIVMDTKAPACRFRGTLADVRQGFNHIKIMGWQRNVSRLRKMDVSLPTIVTLTLNDKEIIEDIELDNSFKGSKGLMCSHKYLNRNLKSIFKGMVFDNSFFHKTKVRKTHCFHLFEVLSGIYSYYQILKSRCFKDIYPHHYSYEEEVIDSYIEDGTLHSLGIHLFNLDKPVHFRLTLHNIINNISFNTHGILEIQGGVRAGFFINEKHILSEVISIYNRNNERMDLSKFLFSCIKQLKPKLCLAKNIRMFNTNLYPRAYIGMLIQSVAIRLFNNNYNYIMHALTSLQRINNTPLCIGAIIDKEEAKTCFPGFSFSDLI